MGDVEIVDKIIGPMGPTCPVTGKILDVTNGQWVHENTRALDGGFIGFHVPQVIIPEYAANPIKWDEIYQSYNKFDRNKFLQEIMGIPTEEGVREITQHDLERICTLGSREALRRKAINNGYKLVVSGCDWGGSDYNPALAIKASYTVHAIIGVNHDNSMEIIFIRQHSGMDYRAVANEIIKDHTAYGGNAMASDFGVGAAYNMLIRESGRVTPDRHFIFNYTGPSAAPVTSPAQGHGWYNQYGLNRTESITSLYAAIKKDPPRLRCYSWDESGPRLMEFLNLYRAPTESTTTGAFSFRYIRHGSKPDDTLHAVNFAYSMARIFIGEPIIQDEALKLRVEQVLRHGNAIKNPLDMLYRGGVVSG
jgi:hypothetical protein